MTDFEREIYNFLSSLSHDQHKALAIAQENHNLLTQILEREERIKMALDKETAVVVTLTGEADTIIAGIDALKAAAPAEDTTALDAALASLKTKIDAAAADAAPAPVAGA